MPPATHPFESPPLALAVLEIRYPALTDGVYRKAHLRLREDLRDDFPLVEYITENEVEVAVGGPVGASSVINRRTYPRFTTRDRTSACVVKDAALVVETTTYAGWELSFRPLIDRVISAFRKNVTPDGVNRIGLRYIDEIRVPEINTVPGDWRDYIAANLLAATDPSFVPESLTPTTWQGLVQYGTASDSTLTVRYGPQDGYAVNPQGSTRRNSPPPPGPFFLLDSDSFWQASDLVPEFDAGWVLEMCDSLHKPTREFFRIAATDKLRSEVFDVPRSGA